MNIYRYATLLILLEDNKKLIAHYEARGFKRVAAELKKNSDKYMKEINDNMGYILDYDEDEVGRIIASCNGDVYKLGESYAMSDKYNRTAKENRGK